MTSAAIVMFENSAI